MDGFILKNDEGTLGLIVLDEPRVVRKTVYSAGVNRLNVFFKDGSFENLLTPIDPVFAMSFRERKDMLVAHFASGGLEGDPTKEYHVPLSTAAISATEDESPMNLTASRPWERFSLRIRR